jgi:hypothetical protein
MNNWDFFGLGTDRTQLIIAGALGGLVRWLTLRDHWSDGIIAIIVGALCATFVSPLALPALTPLLGNVGMPPESVNGFSGFLIGVGGISVSGLLLDVWRLRRKMLRATPPNEGKSE